MTVHRAITEDRAAAGDRNLRDDLLEARPLRRLTGCRRTGCCGSGPEDRGAPVNCAELTAECLAFSKARGKDLDAPRPAIGFFRPQARRSLVPGRRPLAGGGGGRCGPARGAARDPCAGAGAGRACNFKRHALDLA